MTSCDEYAIKTLRYLDNALEGLELKGFLSHLEACASCRENLEEEKQFSAALRRSRPLYSAPAALRDRVTAALVQNSAASSVIHDPVYQREWRTQRQRLSGAWQSFASWRVLASAAVAIALCLAVVPNVERRVHAASYVETAVASHRKYVNGDLQPGLKSGSP